MWRSPKDSLIVWFSSTATGLKKRQWQVLISCSWQQKVISIQFCFPSCVGKWLYFLTQSRNQERESHYVFIQDLRECRNLIFNLCHPGIVWEYNGAGGVVCFHKTRERENSRRYSIVSMRSGLWIEAIDAHASEGLWGISFQRRHLFAVFRPVCKETRRKTPFYGNPIVAY